MMQTKSEPEKHLEFFNSAPARSSGSFPFMVFRSTWGTPLVGSRGWLRGPCLPAASALPWLRADVAPWLATDQAECVPQCRLSHIKGPLNSILIRSVSQILPLECLQSFLAPVIAFCLPSTSLNCGWALVTHRGVNRLRNLVVSCGLSGASLGQSAGLAWGSARQLLYTVFLRQIFISPRIKCSLLNS